MNQLNNPFVHATPLEHAGELVGREEELGELEKLVSSGTYALVQAPRRYGKTSLLRAAAERWRTAGDRLAVQVDFSHVMTIEEAARRVRRAYQDDRHGGLGGLLRELFDRMEVSLGPVHLGRVTSRELDHSAELHELLEMPLKVAERTGRRTFVAFDEFQDVLAIEGLDGLLRSHLQYHQPHVTYVFAGSEPSLLHQLFSDRSRPLYGQAHPLELGPISPELLGEAIAAKFEATGREAGIAAPLVAAAAAGHPQRTMLLAWHLWNLTSPDTVATREHAERALEAALADRQGELDGAWRSFSDSERRAAIALAHGLAPSGPHAQRALAMPARSTGLRGVRALRARGYARDGADGATTLIDPLLAEQIRRENPLDRGSAGARDRGGGR